MYDTVGYARSRLNDTIITHNDEPIHVIDIHRVNNKFYVIALNLVTGDEVRVLLDECNIKPVSLGYVNYNKSTFYSMRMPMRRDWRQGLRYINLVDVSGRQYNGIGYGVFVDTIMNNYPTFENALSKLTNCTSIAFNRDFAISKTGDIEYKGVLVVANYNERDKAFTIHKGWVREALDEALGV